MKNIKFIYPFPQRAVILIAVLTFLAQSVFPLSLSFAQEIIYKADLLPPPDKLLSVTNRFEPAMLKGLKVYPDNPLRFDFILDSGDSGMDQATLKKESSKLIKYFLASLTVPEQDMWVNLSPYEKDRIIPEEFGMTDMGHDLLAQDYLLKQLTASLIYPEQDLGAAFWERVYQKAYDILGHTDIPVNTFNKVWILPDKANLYINDNIAFVVESHLKVMLESDYKTLNENLDNENMQTDRLAKREVEDIDQVSASVVRDIIIPELEKEVNTGEHFAMLRQIYHAMILATWYKNSLKRSFLGQVYVAQNKVDGIDAYDPKSKLAIYEQYIQAFKEGVYNYVKEEYNPQTQEIIPRKYFSGGITMMRFLDGTPQQTGTYQQVDAARSQNGFLFFIASNFLPHRNLDGAMLTAAEEPQYQNLFEVAYDKVKSAREGYQKGLEQVRNWTRRDQSLTEEEFLALHKKLGKTSLNELIEQDPGIATYLANGGFPGEVMNIPGEYRTSNMLGIRRIISPDFNNISQLINGMLEWMAIREQFIRQQKDVQVKQAVLAETAAFIHYTMSLIHPFTDGTGRMARLMVIYLLERNGFTFLDAPRQDYELAYNKDDDAWFGTRDRRREPADLKGISEYNEFFAYPKAEHFANFLLERMIPLTAETLAGAEKPENAVEEIPRANPIQQQIIDLKERIAILTFQKKELDKKIAFGDVDIVLVERAEQITLELERLLQHHANLSQAYQEFTGRRRDMDDFRQRAFQQSELGDRIREMDTQMNIINDQIDQLTQEGRVGEIAPLTEQMNRLDSQRRSFEETILQSDGYRDEWSSVTDFARNARQEVLSLLEDIPELLGDQAMLGESREATEENVGGIDLNPALLELNTQGEDIDFDVPVAIDEIDAKGITGFTPVIFQITPIQNLPLLLGEKGKTDWQLAQTP